MQLVTVCVCVCRNLLVLKQMPDVSDMGLDFTVVNNDLGKTQVDELKAGGRDIVLTNGNKIEYIHLMSNYRLNRQVSGKISLWFHWVGLQV